METIKGFEFKEIYDPEYYMEVQGYETRIMIKKFRNVIDTLGFANISLIYSDSKEYTENEVKGVEFVRLNHLRHAIMDLNNAYDLLLQVPWFFYRMWNEFSNIDGKFYDEEANLKAVDRNVSGWVEIAESMCGFERVHKYLKDSEDSKLVEYDKRLRKFSNNCLFNDKKEFTVRVLANMMKHKTLIQFKEFNEPTKLKVNINGLEFYPKDKGLSVSYKQEFYDLKSGEVQGKFEFYYEDDIYIDIHYNDGECFRANDFLDKKRIYSLDQVKEECIIYYNGMIGLCNELYSTMIDKIDLNPILNASNMKINNSSFNLNDYFLK